MDLGDWDETELFAADGAPDDAESEHWDSYSPVGNQDTPDADRQLSELMSEGSHTREDNLNDLPGGLRPLRSSPAGTVPPRAAFDSAHEQDGQVYRRQQERYPSSMPAAQMMGSSAPIKVPFWKAAHPHGEDSDDDGELVHPTAAATFIPPHQLSYNHQDFLSNLAAGASLGFSEKKDKLRVRNAILRSTGFLEQSPAPAAGVEGGGPSLSDSGTGGLLLPVAAGFGAGPAAVPDISGGLSQALGVGLKARAVAVASSGDEPSPALKRDITSVPE